ncbi:DUF3426 domain-containing protein [Luteimonas sp. S4-F44]|uniref:DUF3426 domain-containing protein n=1 Tax=Luteimonas sp. S4-F44 TaxID=2925842 RepID=UPI001F53000C|nr:DUF3426 domain-containing protein [Luteimonas sp. S4-F44]UNK41981.1 DUF3426 domain-containing protein [Luteimonas sp. S4-F44]
MFIHCRHCGDLVATDRATGLPPARCPRCAGALHAPAPPEPPVSVANLLRPRLEPAAPPSVTAAAPPPARPAGPTRQAPAPPLDDTPRAIPSFARSPAAAAPARARRWLWAAVVGLAMLLVLQGLLAERARLAAHPAWRPALESLCGVLPCALPPWREPAALVLLARDVRAEPEDPTRLQVTATFRNDARWPQAWPRLRLVLSDIDGHAIGSRVFTAQEYLGGAPPAPTLAPGATAHVGLTVAEPEPGAVSFAFELL